MYKYLYGLSLIATLSFAAQCPSQQELEASILKVNAIRAQTRSCGENAFSKTQSVTWNALLYQAAMLHVKELSLYGVLQHQSKDGRDPGKRILQAGYKWQAYGENIALGQESIEEVLSNWLQSVPHCETLMQPNYQELALACAKNQGRLYWVLEMTHAL